MSEIESIDGEIEIICGQTRLFAVKNASRRGGTVIAARRTSSVGVSGLRQLRPLVVRALNRAIVGERSLRRLEQL